MSLDFEAVLDDKAQVTCTFEPDMVLPLKLTGRDAAHAVSSAINTSRINICRKANGRRDRRFTEKFIMESPWKRDRVIKNYQRDGPISMRKYTAESLDTIALRPGC